MTADTASESEPTATQTKFVAREFETSVTDDDRERVTEVIVTAVSDLREQSRLERLLRAEFGNTALKTEYTHENGSVETLEH